MCGIAGVLLSPHAAFPRRLTAIATMTASLRHRGPDGDGLWIDRDAGIALGHRRLAILDLSETGRQPMISRSGRLVITYNGELYNFRDVRLQLEAEGHCFRGHSDTEVMLSAFESWGVEPALRRFVGMFALGLWDRRDGVLHLVRDRLGKKPLYVAGIEGGLIFASELKALRTFPGFDRPLNLRALALMLRQGWIPDHQCIWDGVLKVPPGGMISIDVDALDRTDRDWWHSRVRIWWSLAEVAEHGQQGLRAVSTGDAEAQLDALLRTAVRERMVADVPLGALLSGGIDSSTVVALMQTQSSRPIRTFTIGFCEAHYDEGGDAAGIAHYLGTEHTELQLTSEVAFGAIPKLPRIWDEPFGDESQIPTFLVAQLAREHVTVALSGDGGDECFGGYTRHSLLGLLAPVLKLPLRIRRMGVRALLALSSNSWDALLRGLPLPANVDASICADQLQKLAHLLDATDDRDLYQRVVSVSYAGTMLDQAIADPAPAQSTAVPMRLDPISNVIYRDTVGYLPGDILVKLDRASMAVGLEARCPLLDHRVLEFAWRQPISAKVRHAQGKWLLRRVLRRYVPEPLFARPKHGFNVPIGAWLKGPLRDWAEDLLVPARLSREGFLDPVRVQACWQEHLVGRRNRTGELWALLMFQAWLQEARKGAAAAVAPGMLANNTWSSPHDVPVA